jgi:crotonobetainyl-CoA:carnitine CoA-transferase CaiB-like acyl-CoA transferase
MQLPSAQLAEKRILSLEEERAEIARAAAAADVLLTSSDVSRGCASFHPERQIACDITAYGASGPMAGKPHCDALVQAFAGLADTTGEPNAPPTLCPFPQTEGMAALYAAAGVLTALRVRERSGFGQGIEIALFDCAFSTLSTFLPFHFSSRPVTRAGNRHVLASPWNAYRAADGWLLICTGSDEQWRRLCEVMHRPDLVGDARLGKAPDRVQHRAIVDAAVQDWLAALPAAEAACTLDARGIAAGEIVGVRELAAEPNIVHRGLYSRDGVRTAIRYFSERPDAGLPARPPGEARIVAADAALADLTVLEIGQYTTAPLVARNLGALGARVLKIEPPAGDATRAWPPQHDGQGYFFTLSNSDKVSLCLDLRAEHDRARFRALLTQADVLVENLKPGSLDKLGYGPALRNALNPRLVYCAISGFGADSSYPGRPAFDTVIQAVSGIMDLVRVRDVPQKTGISFADVLGGLFALIGTLAALVAREVSGSGDAIDISMQDAGAWISQWTLADPAYGTRAEVVACADGYAAVEANDARIDPAWARLMTRAALVAELEHAGMQAAPVLPVGAVAASEHALAREVLRRVRDSAGRDWQVFACPIRLRRTPPRARRAIGPLGEANADPSGLGEAAKTAD